MASTTAAKVGAKRSAAGAKRKQRELSLDEQFAKALNHPLRTQILVRLQERPMAPVELEKVMGEKLTNVAYHCRVLLKYKCVEVAGKQQVRGAMKTKYRATTRMLLDRENWDRLSPETRNGISINAVGEVVDRATQAIEADTFDKRTERSVITLKFDADEPTWLK